MLHIPPTTEALSWEAASEDVAFVWGPENMPKREISDAAAKAVAAKFADTDGPGWSMAVLAAGIAIPYEPFRDDLSALFLRTRHAYGAESPEYIALCCLGTWALNHPDRDKENR